jgi:hypothetical protein
VKVLSKLLAHPAGRTALGAAGGAALLILVTQATRALGFG